VIKIVDVDHQSLNYCQLPNSVRPLSKCDISNQNLKSQDRLNSYLSVHNIEGSQERTVIDFIGGKSSKDGWREGHTINTNDSFEPSVADEVEYCPPMMICEDLDATASNRDVNEGTDEYDSHLINKVRKSDFLSTQVLPETRIYSGFSKHQKDSIRPEVERQTLSRMNKIEHPDASIANARKILRPSSMIN